MTEKTQVINQAVNNEIPIGHGNTPAAWAFTGIGLFGALIATIAACIPSHPWVYVGFAVIIIGGIVSYAMKQAGYGKGGSKLKPNQH
ncbi:MAG: HGxxPAAW family protein [Micrococcaceae bacterium]